MDFKNEAKKLRESQELVRLLRKTLRESGICERSYCDMAICLSKIESIIEPRLKLLVYEEIESRNQVLNFEEYMK